MKRKLEDVAKGLFPSNTYEQFEKKLTEEVAKDYPQGIPWTVLFQIAWYAWSLWSKLRKNNESLPRIRNDRRRRRMDVSAETENSDPSDEDGHPQ